MQAAANIAEHSYGLPFDAHTHHLVWVCLNRLQVGFNSSGRHTVTLLVFLKSFQVHAKHDRKFLLGKAD